MSERKLRSGCVERKNEYAVMVMSSVGVSVDSIDFSPYQVVYYVTGIAHQKETKENVHLYYEVNRDLACSVAGKAKQDGVSQFVLVSTLSVYGMNVGIIWSDTKEQPVTHYGKSKLQADCKIQKLMDDNFNVTILRPPMVYEAGCKGNYQRLRSLALKTSVFPLIKNQRSMIYIDNLCCYVERVICENITGIRIPQNRDYVCTSEMVRLIAKEHGRKILFIKLPGILIQMAPVSTVKKVFGSLICDYSESREKVVPDFEETIHLAEKGERLCEKSIICGYGCTFTYQYVSQTIYKMVS